VGDAIEDEMNGDDNEGAGLSTDLSKLPLWLRSVTWSAMSHVQREPQNVVVAQPQRVSSC
jgi:hypothetical protein